MTNKEIIDLVNQFGNARATAAILTMRAQEHSDHNNNALAKDFLDKANNMYNIAYNIATRIENELKAIQK